MKVKKIAVDAGKYGIKAVMYDQDAKTIYKDTFRTKMTDGDFRDDAIERDTYVAEIEGRTYKIGNGARGTGATLVTSKQDYIHKNSTLLAIANFCEEGEENVVDVAIGLPAMEWLVVQKRMDFKDFIFDKPEYTVRVKEAGADTPVEKHFSIRNRYVYPESVGAIMQDDSPNNGLDGYYGVIDCGNLNVNCVAWQSGEIIPDASITSELGAATLIQGLSQELSSKFSRCDERMVEKILARRPRDRYLDSSPSMEVQEQSRKIIADYLLSHVKKIKRVCDGREWSLDFMKLIAIGGASLILEDELKEVFGGNLVVLKHRMFANALGFLRMMCAKDPEINTVIPFNIEKRRNTPC